MSQLQHAPCAGLAARGSGPALSPAKGPGRVWSAWRAGLLLMFGVLALATPLQAQWTSQSLDLRPGWNAVYLEVQPEPRECNALFADLPIESVWRWNRRVASVQFIQDTNQPIADPKDWLTWINPKLAPSGQSSLFRIEGGVGYLIKVSTAAQGFSWVLRGVPSNRKIDWLADSFNFVGFSLPVGTAPTFNAFFAPAPELAAAPVYRLNSAGVWQNINPTNTLMQRGEAFWVRAAGSPDYAGPFELEFEQRGGLDFGRAVEELTLRIRNASLQARTLTATLLPLSPPPVAPEVPALAGPVPLSYWQNDFANNRLGWAGLPASLVVSNLPAGATWELRLAIRRRDLAPLPASAGPAGAVYASLLEVRDATGLQRRLVPITAEGIAAAGVSAGFAAASEAPSTHPRAGLWIGSVSLNRVNQPAAGQNAAPQPTASEFPFRILVHVDGQGRAAFLQKILQLWQPGTYRLAEDGSTNLVVDRPGRFVLVADDRLAGEFSGAALRDGRAVARRFSTAAFAFRDPIAMGARGEFGEEGSVFGCVVNLDYRDPLNPFVHLYHPDHNNLDELYRDVLPESYESFSVSRTVSLQFRAEDPERLALAGWGDSQVGGLYSETITGLHKDPISLSGTFRLHRSSRVDRLETQGPTP